MKKTRAPYNNNGEFKDFNAVDGTLGTVISAEDQNARQDEICNVIDKTGQEQNYNDNQQLAKAIGIQSTISNLFLDTGTANNYILNRPANFIEPFELRENIVISFIPQNANTGASTINFCGLGTYPIKNISGTDLEAGDIVADSLNYLVFSGNAFKIITFSAPTMPADSAENKIASTKFVQNVLLSVALEFLKYYKILPDGSLILEKQKDPSCVDPYFVVMSTTDLANISGMVNNDIVVVANAGNNAATYKYDGSNWVKLNDIVLDTGFLFACKKDNHGYYWFGNEWNILDFSFNPDEFGKLAASNTWTNMQTILANSQSALLELINQTSDTSEYNIKTIINFYQKYIDNLVLSGSLVSESSNLSRIGKKTYFQIGNDYIGIYDPANGLSPISLYASDNIKQSIATLATPSSRYVDLSLPADNVNYQFSAPANGYYSLVFHHNTNDASIQSHVYLHKDNFDVSRKMFGTTNIVQGIYLPVQKGEVVTARLWTNVILNYFRFVYLEGN